MYIAPLKRVNGRRLALSHLSAYWNLFLKLWWNVDATGIGKDRNGYPIKGRDWVKADVSWRARPDRTETVYIKSSVASARVAISDYLKAADEAQFPEDKASSSGVLYPICLNGISATTIRVSGLETPASSSSCMSAQLTSPGYWHGPIII